MTRRVKVVVIGAGSASFGRGTIADLMASERLREVGLWIVLVDIDPAALRKMGRFARLLKDHYRSAASVSATTDRKRALRGADFAISSIALKRAELWERDYRVPVAYGFRQIDGENGGPGAAFHALRSIHLTMPICRDMERLCPEALFLNFSNPESRVCLAVSKLSRIRSVGLCHGAFSTWDTVADVLGRPREEIVMTIGGLNHFHWVTALREARTGRDLMPTFDRRMRSYRGLEPLTRAMYDLFGCMPFPSAIHTGEYVQWAWDMVDPLWRHGQERSTLHVGQVRPSELGPKEPEGEAALDYLEWLAQQARELDAAVRKGPPLSDEIARPSGELAVPIIEDVVFDLKRRELSVNIPNSGAIPNLPDDGIVEIPAVCDAQGVHPEPVGPLPEPVAALCRTQVTIQKLIVEAYRQRSKKLLLQALVLDPVVDSVPRAREMMERMLQIEKDFLPALE
jgi:alpha-galactosidase